MTATDSKPFADYLAQDGVNNSALKWFRKSPAHYKAYRDGLIPSEPSAAQRIGTLTHALILEGRVAFEIAPDTYPSGSETKPWNRNATYCKEWEAAQDNPVISRDAAKRIWAGRDAVMAHPVIGKLFVNGEAEKSLTAVCPKSGLTLKSRLDYLKPRQIIDLKTAADASTGGFGRAIAKYRYAQQAAFYRYVAHLNGLDIVDCIFVALEFEPIPMANALLLSEQDLDIATQDLHRTLARLAECEEENHWPGYCDDQPHKIVLPPWAHSDGDEEALDLNA